MAKTIVQKIVFKNTKPSKLFSLYLDAKLHSLIAGAPMKISKRVGAKFSGFGNYLSGKNLMIVKDTLIVQAWRATTWDKKEPDSIFIIRLETKGKDTILHATHANLPDKAVAGISKGWNEHYWNPWKQYLAGKPITRPTM